VLTMNSVKILHAVRSAITATAELLVVVVSVFTDRQTLKSERHNTQRYR